MKPKNTVMAYECLALDQMLFDVLNAVRPCCEFIPCIFKPSLHKMRIMDMSAFLYVSFTGGLLRTVYAYLNLGLCQRLCIKSN